MEEEGAGEILPFPLSKDLRRCFMYKENKIVALVVFGFFAAACLFTVTTVAGDARLFPVIACILGMVFAAALFIHTCINEKLGVPVAQASKITRAETVKVVMAFVMILVYSILISVIGWVTATVLFMVLFSLYFGSQEQKKIKTTVICLVTVAVLYILFAVAMNTVLPKGLLI